VGKAEKIVDNVIKMKDKDFGKLVEEYSLSTVEENGIIKAKVVQVTDEGILMDIGRKREGFMPWGEFSFPREKAPELGEVIKVCISQRRKGQFLLSKKEADLRLTWAKFEEAFKEEKPLVVKVEKVVKGGLLSSFGPLKAFIPSSHVSLKKKNDLKHFVGKNIKVRVIKLEKRLKNIVLSRKFLLLEEKEKRKDRTLSELEEGKIVNGKVGSITDFGVFVDLGGVDGLIHPENLSWGWVKDPHQVVSLGEKIEVVILKLDKDKRKISLGLKQTQPDPWNDVEKKYQVGSKVKGKVTHLTNFGAFVEVEKGLEGLIHISDLTWDKYVQHPQEILHEGEEVEAKILDIDAEKRKISLGLKQTQPEPWGKLLKECKKGDIISGKVQEVTNFGIFVNLIPGVDGFIHISELSKEYVPDPKKIISIGEEVKAKIINIDLEKKRIRLSIKEIELEEERKRREEERKRKEEEEKEKAKEKAKEEAKKPEIGIKKEEQKQKEIKKENKKEEIKVRKEKKKKRRVKRKDKKDEEEKFVFLENEEVVIGDFIGKGMRGKLKELSK